MTCPPPSPVTWSQPAQVVGGEGPGWGMGTFPSQHPSGTSWPPLAMTHLLGIIIIIIIITGSSPWSQEER